MSSAPLRYRALRLCSNGGGIEALPEQRVSLDLADIRRRLESGGIAVTDARVMLIVSTSPEITLSRSGRLLVKTSDHAAAVAAVSRFFSLAGLSVEGELGRSLRTG